MKQRLSLLLLAFTIAFFLVICKLFYWQIIDAKRLAILAAAQYRTKRETSASRGKILSQDNYPLVLNTKAYLLYVNPQSLEMSPFELADKLKSFIDVEKIDFKAVSDKKYLWYPLAKQVSTETKEEIEKLKIDALGFEESEVRFYPEGSSSAQFLGFVGEDEAGKKKGYFGLEGYYDHEVRGKEGAKYYEKDALGRPISLTQVFEEKPIAGRNLVLNLDRSLQFFAEQHLKKGIEKSGAISGSVVVMDPHSGAVLAMAAYPSYDPARYFLYDEDLFRNPVISSSFEPGSIFKVVAMSAGIDSGAVRPADTCPICSGPRQIYDYSIKTWNEKYYPNSSMTDIIVHSDNVGMTYVSEKMGLNRFYDYLKKFGIGERTGIDLQGEIAPPLREKKDWREIDLATASFGQGIAVTPIQILTAVSAIANGGTLYQPQVVKKIFEDSGSITINPVVRGKPISANTAKAVTEMMVAMVENNNTRNYRPEGYRIAGKSGTAQIPVVGKYDPTKTNTSFIGFAPADNPRFSMLVTLREPKSSQWAEATAAPIWFDIAKEIFRLWEIPPSE
ncbi:MAG: peptidoglycan D,D-transpeptidase FtsI family protein [Patescibacteria group bacterium]|jgi:cell division protein FtsI (penicillin-binding protein 3)